MRTKLSPLAFRLYRDLSPTPPARVLIACSGGLDSVVLAHALSFTLRKLNASFALGHVHHGFSESVRTRDMRNRAPDLVRTLAKTLRCDYFCVRRTRHARELKSEAELREFRLARLEHLRTQHAYTHLAFGHHADDLLETRLIRLIRGTGTQGLRAMQPRTETSLRPLLSLRKAELLTYAEAEGLKWIEDPSNEDHGPLRNWIRGEWLPALELKRAGSMTALARSLDLLANDGGQTVARSQECGVDRLIYDRLSDHEKRSVLADALLNFGVRDFSTRHIEEVVKRLATKRKQMSFRVARCEWVVNAEQIRLTPVP